MWQVRKLGEIFTLKYGKALTAEKRIKGDFKVYSSGGVCGYSDDTLCTNGIVVGRKGTVGSVYYSETPFFAIDTAFYIDEFHNADKKFVYYYLNTLHLESYNNDAAVPGLNRNLVHKLKGNIPPLPIQKNSRHII